MMVEKVRTAWILMRVKDVKDISLTLSKLIGTVENSNFLKTRSGFDIPVLTEPMRDVEPGDVVRLSYYLTEQELKDVIERRTFYFGDRGIKYEVLSEDGWNLLYEDDDPNFK